MTLLAEPTVDGWLVPESCRVLTPHRYGPRHKMAREVLLAVYHYTASPYHFPPHGADEDRIRSWLSGKRSRSSTHFVALRDGRILQGAPLDARTWHAGRSSWVDPDGRRIQSVNAHSIGVDLENVGLLERDDRDGWLDAYGRRYAGADPFLDDKGRGWEPYTPQQIDAACALASRLARTLPGLDEPARPVGHQDVAPRRKIDPGPAFPWGELRDSVAHAGIPW